MQKVNLLIYDVNRSVKKVYKIIYKSVDRVHELVYLIGVNRTGNRKDKTMINNILEMRNDYNDIYIRCSECRDLPTVDERRKEAGRIVKDFNLYFEKYAVVDLIGKEFLKRA